MWDLCASQIHTRMIVPQVLLHVVNSTHTRMRENCDWRNSPNRGLCNAHLHFSLVLGALRLSSPETNESTSTHHYEHVSTTATVHDLARQSMSCIHNRETHACVAS